MSSQRVGFISFRFAGTDGVTLEVLKWVEAFKRLGYDSYFCGGEISMPKDVSMTFPEMHFSNEKMLEITNDCFSSQDRSSTLTTDLHNMRKIIKKQIYEFIKEFKIDLLVPQNVLAIPMNIPLSMALVEVIAETRIPTIAHHHDFYWERERFSINGVQDILRGCFPPNLANVSHVVINRIAQHQLAFRYGISSSIVPNVMDFANPPVGQDEYNANIRQDLKIDDDALFILQPTRIVQRKGIEQTIEIAKRMNKKCTIIISHESGDEGGEYKERVLEYADMLGVDVRLTADIIGEKRKLGADGNKIYDLNDVYAHCDFVTYPSLIEGFGNALLETYYFRKPIVVNTYPVYTTDIKPKRFKAIEFSNFIPKSLIQDVYTLLESPKALEDMTDTNYILANKHFSYELLEKKLLALTRDFFGV